MLALFFDLARFLGAFCASCCVCCRVWLVFMRLGALLLDFGGFRKSPGRVLEAPRLYFSRLFCPRTHAMRKKPDRRFVLEKPIRNACRPSRMRCKNQAKFDSGACPTELSAKVVLPTRLGACRARFVQYFWTFLTRFLEETGTGFELLLETVRRTLRVPVLTQFEFKKNRICRVPVRLPRIARLPVASQILAEDARDWGAAVIPPQGIFDGILLPNLNN